MAQYHSIFKLAVVMLCAFSGSTSFAMGKKTPPKDEIAQCFKKKIHITTVTDELFPIGHVRYAEMAERAALLKCDRELNRLPILGDRPTCSATSAMVPNDGSVIYPPGTPGTQQKLAYQGSAAADVIVEALPRPETRSQEWNKTYNFEKPTYKTVRVLGRGESFRRAATEAEAIEDGIYQANFECRHLSGEAVSEPQVKSSRCYWDYPGANHCKAEIEMDCLIPDRTAPTIGSLRARAIHECEAENSQHETIARCHFHHEIRNSEESLSVFLTAHLETKVPATQEWRCERVHECYSNGTISKKSFDQYQSRCR